VAVKTRLDLYLVARGLCPSRALAQRFIMAGQVFVAGQLVDKPATKVPEGAQVELKALPRYVSRGGDKLEAALAQFELSVAGKVCLDVGASTGGFSDCLLQHGAKKVYAVDVGKHQLHPRLRADLRVVVLEQLNARALSAKHVPEPVDVLVCDVSFISLTKVLPAALSLLKHEGDVVALVKPQFEAGRKRVGRGGVVKDRHVHLDVLRCVAGFVRDHTAWWVTQAAFSPLRGPAGNVEFLFHCCTQGAPRDIDFEALVSEAHRTLCNA